MSNEDVMKLALQKLQENKKAWLKQFNNYVKSIARNNDNFKNSKKKFHNWDPFKLYLNTTNAQKNSTLNLSVRYLGQEVANLSCGYANSATPLLNTMEFNSTNTRDFNCVFKVDNKPWNSKESSDFRNYFIKTKPIRTSNSNSNNEEHRLESLLLSEFSKPRSEKLVKWIQPIRLSNYFRYPMPTAISASDHENIHYSSKPSNIDILTKIKRGNRSHLCIIELKDENKSGEPPALVIQQALAYTVFIHELLRNDNGEKWWKLFGFNKPIPEKLILYAACAMPSNKNDDYSFAGTELSIGEKDIIQLHYIYFKEENNEIKEINASWAKKPN